MDPQATWREIVSGTDPEEIREHARALYNWLYGRGFRPRAVNSRGEELPDGFALRVGWIRFAKLADGTIGVQQK